MKDFYIHDIEVYNDVAFVLYKKVKDDNFIYFDLLKDKQKHKAFFEKTFIIDKNYLIGFNNWAFDIPVTILFNELKYKMFAKYKEAVNYLTSLSRDNSYKKSIIELLNKFFTQEESKNIYKKYINELNIIDLYLMNKWDDDSRRASLKWVAANINSDNIKETPYNFTENVLTDGDKLNECIDYCKNDIKETEKILLRQKDAIKMRIDLNKILNNNAPVNKFLSLSNTAIGSKIILDNVTKRKKKSVKQLKQEAKQVKYIFDVWNEILFDNVKQYLKNNKELHEEIFKFTNGTLHRNKEYGITFHIKNTLTKETYSEITLAKGGGHGLMTPGYIQSDHETMIIDFDVASYYPSIVLGYDMYPMNIGKEFIEVYNYIKEERFKYPKGHSLNKAYKEALNSIVGLSNLPSSILFDPHFFFRVTLNGQAMLVILIHELIKHIDLDLVQLNTDGATIKIKRQDKEKADEIFEWWQETFRFKLEFVEYTRMIIEHVNSYIAEYKVSENAETVYDKGTEYVSTKDRCVYKLKCKGRFIFDDKDIELHKNNSARIIPKAIANYFFKGISITETILSEKELELFLCFQRINTDTKLVYIRATDYMMGAGIDKAIEYKNKVVRYVYTDDKQESVVMHRVGKNGYKLLDKDSKFVYICNDIKDREKIMNLIDRKQYIIKANKLITDIQKSTSDLFNLFNT
jgi:hypothetical protein